MYLYITITDPGDATGPFNIYSNVDGYVSAFETNVSLADLLAGFPTNNVPDGTVEIRVVNLDPNCNNSIQVGISPLVYYFIPSDSQPTNHFTVDFINGGNYAYVYGAFKGYWNGSYEVPGNHLVKLNPDLSVETSFDILEGFNDHIVYIGATLTELLDGSVVLVGFFTSFNGVTYNRIIELKPDGTVEELFDVGTGFNNYSTGISQTTDGKYYITGIFTKYNGITANRVIRLLPDGSKDVAFNAGSGLDNAALSTLVNIDNSVYLSGYFSTYDGNTANGIIRLNPDGTIDNSFNVGTGFQPRGTYKGVLMDRIPGEDSIVCVMYCAYCGAGNYELTYQGNSYGNIVKLNPDGSVNAEFAANSGTGFNGAVGLISVVFGNKILITQTAPIFTEYNGVPTTGIALLNADGTLLQAFTTPYEWVYAVGNTLYGTDPGDGLNSIIYEYYDGITTTTTTTTIP